MPKESIIMLEDYVVISAVSKLQKNNIENFAVNFSNSSHILNRYL
jgi:hypothetical protein